MAITYPRTMRGQLEIRESAGWGQDSGAWTYMKAKEVGFPTGLEYQEGDDITQDDAEDIGHVLFGPGDVTLRTGLHPAVSAWPGVAPLIGNLPPVFVLLKSLMGAVTVGGYGVTDSGNTTTVLQFDAQGAMPTAMGFVEGDPIWVRDPAGAAVLGANVIKDVDDVAFTVTIRSPLPDTPDDLAIGLGGYAAPKVSTDVSVPLDLRWTGEAAYDVRKSISCLPSSCGIEAPYRGLAELSMTFRSALPSPPDASESGGGALQQSYPYPETSQVIKGGLYYWNGSTNRKLTGGISIDFGVENSEVGGINGVDPNGIAAMVLSARKIRVKITPAMNADGYALFDVFQNPPPISVLTGWWGVGPRVWMFQIPQAVIVEAPNYADDEGKTMLDCTFGAAEYNGDTGTPGATDGIDKPFVIACLAGATS